MQLTYMHQRYHTSKKNSLNSINPLRRNVIKINKKPTLKINEMKKTLTIISLCFLITNCSTDNDSNPEETLNPTINNLVYAIKSDFVSDTETTKLVTIDPTNGIEMNIMDLQTTDNYESASINNSTNQIFFITGLGDGNVDTEIYTINIANNSFSAVNLNSNPEIDYELLPITYGTLYAIKQSYVSDITTSKLISINPTNGDETVIMDLQTTDNFQSLALNNQTNKIFGITSIGDGNLDSEIYTIDLTNNSYTFQTLSTQLEYELVISENGTLYVVEQVFDGSVSCKLYTINPADGNKTLVVDLETIDNFDKLVFKENKIIGATNADVNDVMDIYIIDVQNNSFSFTALTDIDGIDFELISGN